MWADIMCVKIGSSDVIHAKIKKSSPILNLLTRYTECLYCVLRKRRRTYAKYFYFKLPSNYSRIHLLSTRC